jgi:hypothetical protein
MPHDEVANGEKNPRETGLQQKNHDTMTTEHGRLLYYKWRCIPKMYERAFLMLGSIKERDVLILEENKSCRKGLS